MLGAGLQFGRSRGGDRFYDPAKARRNYQNQQSQDHLWRAQSDDVTVQSQSPSKEDKSVVSKESPKPVVTPALEPVVSPLCNLERFLESIIPSVPAQYLSKVASKKDLVDSLVREGFSKDVAQWVVTNLRQSSTSGSSPSSFSWVFDLNGIAEMYESYEETNLWKIVEDVPRGFHVNFLKAERSLHRWALEDLQRIHTAEELAADEGGGVEMHVLEDAGHWVLVVGGGDGGVLREISRHNIVI